MSAAHTSKIRIYDLAKELKMESKRLIEEVRREGVDVSVPSNTISKELAEKIRNKYFPKKEPTVHRSIRVVKKAKHPDEPGHAPEPTEAPVPEVYAEPHAHEPRAPAEAPHAPDAGTGGGGIRPLTPRLMRLAPAARAEHPAAAQSAPAPAVVPADEAAPAYEPEPEPAPLAEVPSVEDVTYSPTEEAAPAAEPELTETPQTQQPAAAAPAPGRQIRTLRLTDAALKAGVQPGQ